MSKGKRKRAKQLKRDQAELAKLAGNAADKKTTKDSLETTGETRSFYLQVNAVWFDGTVLDTDDISTVRGASLALLFAPDCLSVYLQTEFDGRCRFETIISGASTLILLCRPLGDNSAADIEHSAREFLNQPQKLVSAAGSNFACLEINLANLRFTVAVAPETGLGKAKLLKGKQVYNVQEALAMLNALAARSQYQMPSIIVPKDTNCPHSPDSICQLDHVSPAAKKDHTRMVSQPVLERRQFGREQKEQFYYKVLEYADATPQRSALLERLEGLQFAQSLGDLLPSAEMPDGFQTLPVALSGKIAIIHLDGNKFGKILSGIRDREKLADFSRSLRRLQANMLVELLDWCVPEGRCSSYDNDFIAPAEESEEAGHLGERVRLETLLWGGDEMVFAMPAWRGWEGVGILERALRKFTINSAGIGNSSNYKNKIDLTHAIGLSFANVKTPIRLLRAMAGLLTDSAKRGQESKIFETRFCYQVGVVESLDNPDGDIIKLRNTQFGIRGEDMLTFPGTSGRTVNGSDWPRITGKFRALADVLKPSQVAVLLDEAEAIGLDKIHTGVAGDDWHAFLDGQLKRLLRHNNVAIDAVKAMLCDADIGGNDTMLLSIQWLRYLKDYILPVEVRERELWKNTSTSEGQELA